MTQPAADVASVAASIAADAPVPTTSGLPSITGAGGDPSPEQLNEPANAAGADVDSAGVKWDPAIHSPGKSRKLDGTWRAKKGASGAKAVLPAAPPPPPGPPPHLSDAQALVNLVTGVCTSFFGEDWKPGIEEHAGMTEGTRQTLEHYGGFAMPPWAAMGIAFLMYGASRFHLKSTKNRLAPIGAKISSFWKGLRAGAARKMAAPASAAKSDKVAQPATASNFNGIPADAGFDTGRRAL